MGERCKLGWMGARRLEVEGGELSTGELRTGKLDTGELDTEHYFSWLQ